MMIKSLEELLRGCNCESACYNGEHPVPVPGKKYEEPDAGKPHVRFCEGRALRGVRLLDLAKSAEWNERAFWWPVLVAPKNVPKTIYASKIVGEKII